MSLQSDTASEKAHIEHKESLAQSIDHETQDVDPAFAKRTLRKIDLRLIPILAALYCVSLIDRTNISVCVDFSCSFLLSGRTSGSVPLLVAAEASTFLELTSLFLSQCSPCRHG